MACANRERRETHRGQCQADPQGDRQPREIDEGERLRRYLLLVLDVAEVRPVPRGLLVADDADGEADAPEPELPERVRDGPSGAPEEKRMRV